MQPGRKELEGMRKEGRREGEKKGRGGCELGPAEDKQCFLWGKKRHLWLLSATPFHYKQACKRSKMALKKNKKLDNFQIRNLKCNKSAGETTKRKTVMDYQDGETPSESSQKNMNMW